jgi:hypothetical protein
MSTAAKIGIALIVVATLAAIWFGTEWLAQQVAS